MRTAFQKSVTWCAGVVGFFVADLALGQRVGEFDENPGEALARGPVHEGFANPGLGNPQGTAIVPREPPAAIEELPPEQRPDPNAQWIPGYWAWDDEDNRYIWISGVWRVPPPGQQWTPGYWNRAAGGFQWVPGFWTPIARNQVEYLPQPPDTLDIGPTYPRPDNDCIWAPGNWYWHESRYVWRPGTWVVGRPNWIWVPPRYYWTPGGSVYNDGFWDYPLVDRGALFAPCAFPQPYIVQRPIVYRPRVAINLGLLSVHLFSRPRFNHYYFGDYYEPIYVDRGILPWHRCHGGRYGFDPIYSYYDWDFGRRNQRFTFTQINNYNTLIVNNNLRPRRTFADQNDFLARQPRVDTDNVRLAVDYREVVRDRVARLGPDAVQTLKVDQSRQIVAEMRKVHDLRVKAESGVVTERRERPTRPVAVSLPASPAQASVGTFFDKEKALQTGSAGRLPSVDKEGVGGRVRPSTPTSVGSRAPTTIADRTRLPAPTPAKGIGAVINPNETGRVPARQVPVDPSRPVMRERPGIGADNNPTGIDRTRPTRPVTVDDLNRPARAPTGEKPVRIAVPSTPGGRVETPRVAPTQPTPAPVRVAPSVPNQPAPSRSPTVAPPSGRPIVPSQPAPSQPAPRAGKGSAQMELPSAPTIERRSPRGVAPGVASTPVQVANPISVRTAEPRTAREPVRAIDNSRAISQPRMSEPVRRSEPIRSFEPPRRSEPVRSIEPRQPAFQQPARGNSQQPANNRPGRSSRDRD